MLMAVLLYLFHVKECLLKSTERERQGDIQRESNTEAQMSANEDIASGREGEVEEMGEGKLTFLIGEW